MPSNINRRVTLTVGADIRDAISKLGWVGGKKKELEKEGINVPVDANTKPANTKLDDMRVKLKQLSSTVSSFKVDANDKDATAKIAGINYKLGLLDKKVSQPRISLQGLAKAEADLALLDASFSKVASKAGEDASQSMTGAFQGGIMGPAGLGAAIALALPVVPGLFAVAGAGAAVALGAALAIKGSPVLQAAGKKLVTGLESTLTAASSVLVKPLSGAFQMLSGELPTLKGLLSGTFSAVAPLIRPMVTMITDLVNRTMPGFNAMLRQSTGPLRDFFDSIGKIIGSGFSDFFRQLGPLVGPSLGVIKQLVGVVLQLLNVLPPLMASLLPLTKEFLSLASFALKAVGALEKVHVLLPLLGAAAGLLVGGPIGALIGALVGLTAESARAGDASRKQGLNLDLLKNKVPHVTKAMVNYADVASAVAGNLNRTSNAVVILSRGQQKAVNAFAAYAGGLQGVLGKINASIQATDNLRNATSGYLGVVAGGFGVLKTFRSDLATLAGSLKNVKGNIDGNSGSALQYHADLDTAIGSANQFISKLADQAAAAGHTRAAQNALTEGVKGTIAQLIPFAAKSATGRAEVLALARANGINANNFSQLTKMVGGTTGATRRQTDATNILSKASANATGKSSVLKDALITLARNGLNLTTNQANGLYTQLARKLGPQMDNGLAHSVLSSKGRFEQWAGVGGRSGLGLTAKQADVLYTSLRKLQTQGIDKMHSKNVTVGVNATGSGGIKVEASGIKSKLFHLVHQFADGGRVTMGTGPRADDVPVLVSKGETIVSAKHSQMLAGAFRAAGVPGYASGGPVGMQNFVGSAAKGIIGPWEQSMVADMMTAMSQSYINQMMAAFNVPNSGAGVQRWMGVVTQALKMLNEPWILARNVLYQMQTESGGNPNAINLWDSNAKAGHPSQGLMQLIPGTFSAYHVPGTSWNIRDPLANVAAAINYAKHVYGPTLQRGGMGIGSGHGYDQGGILPPGATLAVNNTGHNEYVINPALHRGGLGTSITWTGNVIIQGQTLATKQDIGREVVSAIQSYEKGSGKSWRR